MCKYTEIKPDVAEPFTLKGPKDWVLGESNDVLPVKLIVRCLIHVLFRKDWSAQQIITVHSLHKRSAVCTVYKYHHPFFCVLVF